MTLNYYLENAKNFTRSPENINQLKNMDDILLISKKVKELVILI